MEFEISFLSIIAREVDELMLECLVVLSSYGFVVIEFVKVISFSQVNSEFEVVVVDFMVSLINQFVKEFEVIFVPILLTKKKLINLVYIHTTIIQALGGNYFV